jgi:hypothetical protein
MQGYMANDDRWSGEGTVLPEGLRYLPLGGGALPEGTVLPEGLVVYQ